ncbi:MAG: hypothetical protein MUE52_13765 [Tabrizicola sp.]|jgi:hypothetical protein|nr:hypothetical protein [Tabrizicola sp.]
MLEDWAWQHIAHSELYVRLFSVGWALAGGVLAAVLHRGSAVLQRAPYFAMTGFVVLGIALFQYAWVMGGAAMQGGWLFWMIALDAAFSAAAGYVLVVLGQARSRDVLGHGKAGIASVVPLANLWLMFAPGQDPSRAGPVVPALRGGIGVALGLAMIVLSRLVEAQILPQVEAAFAAVAEDPALADRFIDLEFARSTPAQILSSIAQQTEVPQTFHDNLRLSEVVAEGLVLTYVYHLLEPEAELGFSAKDDTRRGFCEERFFVRLLNAGAQVVVVFRGTDAQGTEVELGRVSLATRDCQV